MKKLVSVLSIAFLLLSGSALLRPSQGYAHGGEGCSFKSEHGGQGGGCPVVAKFFSKAHYFLERQKVLGLSEQQISDIKALNLDMKKASVKQTADAQIFMLDLWQKLSEDRIDEVTVGVMIDDHAKAMAEAGKENIAAFAKLKAVLSPEQKKKLKDLWLAHEAKEHGE